MLGMSDHTAIWLGENGPLIFLLLLVLFIGLAIACAFHRHGREMRRLEEQHRKEGWD